MLNLVKLNRNIRSLRRYGVILGVLVKYGFGHIVEQLNLSYYLRLDRRLFSRNRLSSDLERLSPQVRMRLAMEELGPTFIKLGQLLSTRPDLIPHEYTDEFGKLQDQAAFVPVEQIRTQIALDLKRPVETLFADFSDLPLAAASIAQVHRARLLTGEEVAVKVLRPGVEELVATDLDILMGLAHLLERHMPAVAVYEPSTIVKEFRRTLKRELDFTREGHTINRFAANFAGDPTIRFPNIFWTHTGTRVLTLEFIDGIKVSDFEKLELAGYDRKIIARNGAETFLRQVLTHGLFHGDPHPGNIFVLPGNTICMLDFGMVGRLGDELKQYLAELLLGILSRDPDRIISQLLYSGELAEEVSMRALKRDLTDFIDDYSEIPLQELNTGRMLGDFVDILVHYRIKFPADFMLLIKALVTMEGVGRRLDPDFNMIGHLKPFMERLVRERTSAGNLTREAGHLFSTYSSLIRNLPRDIKELLNRINRNKFKIDLEHRGLDRLITDIDKSSNRLSFSLLIAALIVGSSLIMQTEKGPMLFGFPMLGFLGYSIAAALGLWLAIAILRSGRL